MSERICQLITKMPQRTCDKCDKSYSSRQSFNAHLKTCGQKKRPGRPPKVQKEPSSDEEEEVSDEEEEEVMPPPKKKTKKKLIIDANWNSTFEKTKKLLEEKRSEEEIVAAIKFDDCFSNLLVEHQPSLKRLKEQVKEKLKSVKDPHRLTKQKINRDFRSLEDKEKREELKAILNIESGISVEKLEEWKVELENELYYVEYGLVIRKLFPTTRALEMILELLPADEENLEDIDLIPTASQQYENLC